VFDFCFLLLKQESYVFYDFDVDWTLIDYLMLINYKRFVGEIKFSYVLGEV